MSNEIQNYIEMAINHQHLSRDQMSRAVQIMMTGGATPAMMAALLVALRSKGETVEELTGAALTMRAKMQKLVAPAGIIDTCGTGGDSKGTLNISTAVALVVAACGVPVAKHGNRSVSSNSGSADVLAALGVNIDASTQLLEKSLRECNICFMMAPRFHPAMRHVAPVRQELGLRTIFNLLGPLANPAQPKRQLVGVFAREWMDPMALTLQNLGSERAWVVHGSDGVDEMTSTGPSFVTELKDGKLFHHEILPENLGFETVTLGALQGKGPDYNARAIMNLLTGLHDAYRVTVIINAAAALVVAEKADDMKQGVAIATDALDSGRTKAVLANMISISNEETRFDD